MALSIKIENFEGPFDLLLHLIKKNKMSIYEIKINDITNQYLDYLKEMKEMDLEITSEFIVIAATLLEIKSRELLPKVKKEDEEDQEDIKKNLIDKLIMYRKFKNASEFLSKKENKFGYMFTKKPEIIEEKKEFDIKDVLKNVTLLDLFDLYNELIFIYVSKMNVNKEIPQEFIVDKYRIEDKMKQVTYMIKANKKVVFSKMVDKCACKLEVIVTFLAMLELIKQRTIKIYQEDNFREIYIQGVEG